MTAKETAVLIRKDLKAIGYTAKMVSVRSERGSVDLTIKALGVNKKAVESIAEKYERVDRCALTGDILSGGNCYIFVNHDWQLRDAFAALAEGYQFHKDEALSTKLPGGCLVQWDPSFNMFSLWRMDDSGTAGSFRSHANPEGIKEVAGKIIDQHNARKAA